MAISLIILCTFCGISSLHLNMYLMSSPVDTRLFSQCYQAQPF